jgi:hypothetical protein
MDGEIRKEIHAAAEIQLVAAKFPVVKINGAFVRRGDAGEAAEEGGFACAVGAEEADDLSRRNFEGDMVERPQGAIRFQYASEFYFHGHPGRAKRRAFRPTHLLPEMLLPAGRAGRAFFRAAVQAEVMRCFGFTARGKMFIKGDAAVSVALV